MMRNARFHTSAARRATLAPLTCVMVTSIYGLQQRFPFLRLIEALALWCCATLPRWVICAGLRSDQGLFRRAPLDAMAFHLARNCRHVYAAFSGHLWNVSALCFVLLTKPCGIFVHRLLIP